MPDLFLLDWLVLAVAIASNVLATIVFATRPGHPGLSRAFGLGYIALAVPAAAIALLIVAGGRPWTYAIPPLLFIAMAILLLLLDYVLRVEFRSPPRYYILGPFLLLFYIAHMGMWGLTWEVGPVSFGVTGATYFAQVAVGVRTERRRAGVGGRVLKPVAR